MPKEQYMDDSIAGNELLSEPNQYPPLMLLQANNLSYGNYLLKLPTKNTPNYPAEKAAMLWLRNWFTISTHTNHQSKAAGTLNFTS